MPDLYFPVDLGDDTTVVVSVVPVGPVPVSSGQVFDRLEGVQRSIERVSRQMLEAAKAASPAKATVELGFTLALQEGQLVALFGKAKGEATVVVTLEWERE